MNRRHFLSGVLGGVSSAGVLIATAPNVLAEFAPEVGSPVTLIQPGVSRFVQPGEPLYNAQGQMVATVRAVNFHREKIEVTTFSSTSQEYIMGHLDIDIHAKGLPFDDYGTLITCSYCKSPRPFGKACLQCGAGAL